MSTLTCRWIASESSTWPASQTVGAPRCGWRWLVCHLEELGTTSLAGLANNQSCVTGQRRYQPWKLAEQIRPQFTDGLRTLWPFESRLHVRSDALPKSFKSRTVPFVLKAVIEQELDHLKDTGNIVEVTHSNWVAPIAPVPTKKKGRFCICGYCQSGTRHRPVPTSQAWQLLHDTSRRHKVYQIWLTAAFSTAHNGWWEQQVCDRQHISQPVSIHPIAIWHCLGTLPWHQLHSRSWWTPSFKESHVLSTTSMIFW